MSNFEKQINNLNEKLVNGINEYVSVSDKYAFIEDSISKVIRTRVTAEFCVSLSRINNSKKKFFPIIKKMTDWLIDNQNKDGSWNETHIKYNQPSTVFTSICALSLLEISELNSELEISNDVFEKAAKYILEQEISSGEYRKSELVHADILNADAMAAAFLLKFGNKCSNEEYIKAGKRAVSNICKHQFIDGAYPYGGPLRAYPYKHHFYIPCIHYQSVTLYYLIKSAEYIKSEWLEHSIYAGTKWLLKNQKDDGNFKWKNSGLNFALYLSATHAFCIPIYQRFMLQDRNVSKFIDKSLKILESQITNNILLRWEKGTTMTIINGIIEAPKGGSIGDYPFSFKFLRIMHRIHREISRTKISNKITPSKLSTKATGYSAYMGTVESSTNYPDLYMTTEALDALSLSLEGMKNK